jgi:hypothetical protein
MGTSLSVAITAMRSNGPEDPQSASSVPDTVAVDVTTVCPRAVIASVIPVMVDPAERRTRIFDMATTPVAR